MREAVTHEWRDGDSEVRVTLFTGPLVGGAGRVRFTCSEQRVQVTLPDGRRWSSRLFATVLPDGSDFQYKGGKVLLRLLKLDPKVKWGCLEPIKIPRVKTLPTTKQMKDMSNVEKVLGTGAAESDASATVNGGPGPGLELPPTPSVEPVLLDNLKYSMFETDSEVRVSIYVKQIKNETISVTYEPDCFSVVFGTRSPLPLPLALPPPPPPPPAAPLELGMTGLDNIGNTCFLNSVIQCLANTRELRDYFAESVFQSDINRDNPLGMSGQLALSFAVLLRVLWSGQHRSHNPHQLKSLVAKKATQFTGFAQHDAQEFMAFLLDGLHEDLNRVRVKPYTQTEEAGDRPDAEVARESWHRYRLRDDSAIVDLFQGQYKSKLVCPDCGKVSVTFDPFLYLSIPLPKKKRPVAVTFFRADPTVRPVTYNLYVTADGQADEIMEKLSEKAGVSSKFIKLIEERRHKVLKVYSRGAGISSISRTSHMLAFQQLDPADVGEPVVELLVIQRLLCPSPARVCSSCFLTPRFSPDGRHSVNVFCVPVSSSGERRDSLSSNTSSDSGKCTDTEEVPAEEEAASGDSADRHGPPPATGGEEKQLFFIKPVNQQGQSITTADGARLQNCDDQPLDLHGNCMVAMDWKTHHRSRPCCLVEDKELDAAPEPGPSLGGEPGADFTLDQCLQLFTEPEQLSPGEAWYCPRCKTHREAEKQMSLWRVPLNLIVQLKRFSFKDFIYRDKIDKMVHFPTRGLDLSPYLTVEPDDGPAVYDLYGVINHHGGILGGHYTAFARCVDPLRPEESEYDWRLFDDSRVSRVTEERVVTQEAYLLFYRRRVPYVATPRSTDAEEID
ncbi:ubiquitin carboxyl-terminal hydrolase 19-like [Pollicipes pollicipes]|uniref:ubiquitin carboxyl-terminal hydrolase 19-like n=1 Tax=Pollicipes pollicipes TaxID=41117 RepID=UPI00188593A7|nr:ubiquitin carboxyl-terminal hydrolase 19-like [Pollicipes pollicipes]